MASTLSATSAGAHRAIRTSGKPHSCAECREQPPPPFGRLLEVDSFLQDVSNFVATAFFLARVVGNEMWLLCVQTVCSLSFLMHQSAQGLPGSLPPRPRWAAGRSVVISHSNSYLKYRLLAEDAVKLSKTIAELTNRCRQLEDALRTLQSKHSNEPHPLLDSTLLTSQHADTLQPSGNNGNQNEDDSDDLDAVQDSLGTLTIDSLGNSNFLGRTAGMHVRWFLYFIHYSNFWSFTQHPDAPPGKSIQDRLIWIFWVWLASKT